MGSMSNLAPGEAKAYAEGARQKLVTMAQAEGLSDSLVMEIASWRITARAGNHYVFHLPDGTVVHSKEAVLAHVRRNKRAIESSLRRKKRKHSERGEEHSGGETPGDGDLSTGLNEPTATPGGHHLRSDSANNRQGTAEREHLRRSARSQNQPKPIYFNNAGYNVPPGRKYHGLDSPEGGRRAAHPGHSPPGQLPLLLGALDEDMRVRHGAGAVLLQILGLVADFKRSDFYAALADPERLRIERYVSAVTTLAPREETRSEQLSVMQAIAPADSGPDAKYALLNFMSNTVDHLELIAGRRR